MCLVIQSFPASVLAQSPGTEAAPTVLQPIVTTATRSERSLADLPVSVTVLDREQITTAPAYATDDILRNVPSLNMPLSSSIVQHPTGNLVGIRGLGAPRVLFLLDGIPINDPFFGYVQFNKIVKETIDRIEVVRGGSASLWGNYAMGGVVNIVTQPTEARAANAEVLYGSDSTVRTNVYGSYRSSESFGVSLNVNYYDTNGYFVASPELRGPIDTRAASQFGNVQVKADYHDARIDGFLRGNFFTQDQKTGTVLSDNSTNSVDIAGGMKWKVDNASDVRASLFFLQEELKTDNTDPVTPGQRDAEFLSNSHQTPVTDLGGSLQYTRRWNEVFREALVGLDLRRIDGEDRAINYASPDAAPSIENAGGIQFFAGLFGQASITPVRGLELLPSVRIDYYNNSNGHDEQSPGTTQNFKDESFGQVNPKLAVRYQVMDPVAVRAAFYRAFRAPNLDELYRPFTAIGFGLRPNPFLKPEVLYGGEGGLDIAHGPFTGQLTYFWNVINDRISTVPISFFPIFVVQNVNLQKTRSRGLEVLGEYRPFRWLSLSGGYTYTNAVIVEDLSNPEVVGARVPNVPKNFATFALRYHGSQGLQVTLQGRYQDGQYNEAPNINKFGEHFVLDLYASYAINKHVEIFLLGQNLTDRQYLSTFFGGGQLAAPFQMFGGVRLAAF
jgi:outer membrane receptor protein involved in Fe transport